MLIISKGNGNHAEGLVGNSGGWNGCIYVCSPGGVIPLAGSGTNSLADALFGNHVDISGGGWSFTGTGPNNGIASRLTE